MLKATKQISANPSSSSVCIAFSQYTTHLRPFPTKQLMDSLNITPSDTPSQPVVLPSSAFSSDSDVREIAVSAEVQALAQTLCQVRRAAACCIQRAFRHYYTSLAQLTKDILRVRCQAATQIQKVARGRLTRKQLPILKMRHKDKLIRWTKPAKEVMLSGTFTKPEWTRLVRMQYLSLLGVFYSTYLMDTKADAGIHYFRFRVDGEWTCSDLYPKVKDIEGHYHNYISLSTDKRIPRAISVKMLDSEAVGNDFASRSQMPSSLPLSSMPRTWSGSLDSPIGKDFREGSDRLTGPVHLKFAGFMAAHPKNKQAPLSGEGSSDRYFIEEDAQAFGLADGVGEWQTFGLDPGQFPSELMEGCRKFILARLPVLKSLSSKDTIQAMVNGMHEAKLTTRGFGSSTSMLALIKDNAMHIIYVGDSSFMVLRKRESTMSMNTVYRSMEQQHSFNCPYQLANLPGPEDFPELLEKGLTSLVSVLKKANTQNQDSALDARTEIIKLQLGDIVIAGSDGLFDNLYDSDITRIVQNAVQSGVEGAELAESLACELVTKAVDKGWDPMYRSPFAKTAQRAGKRFNGGKLDDTSVIVGVATSKED